MHVVFIIITILRYISRDCPFIYSMENCETLMLHPPEIILIGCGPYKDLTPVKNWIIHLN
jgi:hypothetical protein